MNGNFGYIIASDFMAADGSADVSDSLQQLIDTNPNRTIFFPDGTYLLKKPVLTPAHPEKSVDLQLSNYAMFRAADTWNSDEAMIRLGAKETANDIHTPGSNYSLTGGIIDGAGRAKAVSIDGGRETCIRNVSIKNALVGIHIKHGANNGSSDADITGVNIVGNGDLNSIGVLIEGYDNTLTNMRIADVFTGVEIRGGGNMLRNVHPLYIIHHETYDRYNDSVGFRIIHPMNWLDYCYSDQFAVGFDSYGGGIMKNCFCWWYSDREASHIALRCNGSFNGSIDTMVVGGAQHHDHPNRFMESEKIPDDAMIEKVVMVAPDGTNRRII